MPVRRRSWELELVKELGFGAKRARSWILTEPRGAEIFARKKLEVKYLTAQELELFPKRFISKSKKAKLILEMKSKWQITLPSSDKVEVKIQEIVWQLTLLEDK